MKIGKTAFFICFLFVSLFNISTFAAAPKSAPKEPVEILLNFNPFVVSNSKNGKITYTTEMTIRVLVNDTIEAKMGEDVGKIRDSLLTIMRKHTQFKTDYTEIDFSELKSNFANYFKSQYGEDFKKIYILRAYIK